MSGAVVMKRVFVAGRLRIEDEHPELDASESWEKIRGRYPHLRRAAVHEGVMKNGALEIELEVPPSKTNG
ncbi:hypothetical protein A3709_20500 [Halioglobus sp. HI00S01]|uniref:hypothetical protein n=1 Tax=Halioglobus sp. HI00S01 TaxID=1822214 RepID=UPI0007C3746A|nr:hypothetical protein [Halioglobus sp. HI00S01]KZX57994.1 hypothetical protein A3709_20500 [Halioglobus sp. HI00S01]